jgi:predicted amidohydrolase
MATVSCAQLAPAVGDLAGNRERAREAVRAAVSDGADLVVLPELCTSGYVFASPEEARSTALAPKDVASDWSGHGAIVVGGFAELAADGTLFNSAAVVAPGGEVLAVYRKTHLWDRESLFFEPGPEFPPVVETELGRIGVCVCYDLSFPELPRGLALAGADLIAIPTNFPREDEPAPGEPPVELAITIASAHLSRVFVAVCDRAGRERGVDWVGATAIVDERGRVLGGPVGDGVKTIAADCDLARARDKALNERNDVFADRRPELYRGLDYLAAGMEARLETLGGRSSD